MKKKHQSKKPRVTRDREDESGAHVLGPIQSRGRLDGETQKYFLELLPLLEETTDEENRATLCANALEEARGKELQLACHPSCSRVLEKLIESSGVEQSISFLEQSRDTFATIAMDPSGSHVVEAAFKSLTTELTKNLNIFKSIEKSLWKLCEVLKSNAVALMTSKYGSHVLRNFLSLLSGKVFVDDDKNAGLPKKLSTNNTPREKYQQIHQGFPELLKDLTGGILEASKESIRELRLDPSANPALQTIVRSLGDDKDAAAEAISLLLDLADDLKEGRVLENGPAVEEVLKMMENRSGSHLMEVILEEASDALYMELLQQLFRGKLGSLAAHHISNFVVQTLITNARKPGQVNLILDELSPCFADLIENRRAGVIASLMAACGRLNTRQSEVCKALTAAVKATNPIAGLLRLESFTSDGPASRMSVIGCAMLQTMLTFSEKCIRQYFSSFGELDAEDVFLAAKDRAGCHVLEAFLQCPASTSQKLKLMGKLRGHFAELALHSGSHYLVLKSYDASDMKMKETIASELVPVQNELSKTKQGPYMLGKIYVSKYARDPEGWVSLQNSKQATKAAFADMLGGSNKKRKWKA